MNVTLRILSCTPENDVRELELLTLGKTPRHAYSWDVAMWTRKMKARHSTLKAVRFRIIFDDVPSTVARQLARHTSGMIYPYMQSARPDWTGTERPPEPYPVLFALDTDAEGWMSLAEKRLCRRAWAPTRAAIESVVIAMMVSGIPYFEALAGLSRPRCVSERECPEGSMSCGGI